MSAKVENGQLLSWSHIFVPWNPANPQAKRAPLVLSLFCEINYERVLERENF